MRDAHRIKEKIDLTLDSRQIVSLLLGGLVVLGAAFVLGVVVGKKLATSERASSAPDLLTALDAQAEALGGTDERLTFHEELTKKPEAPRPEQRPPKPMPAPPLGGEAEAEGEQPAEAGGNAAAGSKSPAGGAGEAPAERKREEAPKLLEQGSLKPDEPVPTRSLKDGGLREAFARAQRPQEAVVGGAFTLQLSASQDRAEADRFASRLRERGFAPFVVEAQVPGRGSWYRVRMGSFPSREAAHRYLQDFRRETQLEAFVASSN
ncbi:MAG: SPOR domain-containing protein [Myxococcales bacterium]|nr:SPOR domain-containing protein [Myxococcales bacterium]